MTEGIEMIGTRLVYACLGAALLLGGCKQDPALGTVFLKEREVGAVKGGALAVTPEDCAADDAVCDYVGTSIVIPRGALAADTKIQVRVGRDATERDGALAGPAIQFLPAGITFASPVEITIPVRTSVERDNLRVYVTEADGTRSVRLPYELSYDQNNQSVKFLVRHFTTFQCGNANTACSDVACPTADCSNGQCNAPCSDANACGPAPGVPSWTCEDGTPGGFNGDCVRQSDGTCAWDINWCPQPCQPDECGPAPGAPNTICPDGTTIAGPVCRRDAAGTCGWVFETCPDDCTVVSCPPDMQCDPNTKTCTGTTQCGPNTCSAGEFCCNESCGYCVPFNGSCTDEFCGADCRDPNGADCQDNQECDPNTGECVPVGTACGPNFCGADEFCCNASCGICAPVGGTCVEPACIDCSNVLCAPGHTCEQTAAGDVQCVPTPCGSDECGPQPGVPSWTCEDGTPGGSTGNCLRNADGTCGWEIIWCPMQCLDADCGAPPSANDPNTEVCPDGVIPTYDCGRTANNNCEWQRDCG